jgi:hypothetical protein
MDGTAICAVHAPFDAGPRDRRPRSGALNKKLARKRPKNTPFDIRQVALHYWSILHGSRIRKNLDAVLVTGGPSACGEVF